MKHKKLSARILSFVLTAAMVFTMSLTTAFAAEGDAPTGSRFEAITIAPGSLNGNTVWGVTEVRENQYAIMLDDSALFYARMDSRNEGIGGLPTDGKLTTTSGVPYQFASGSDPAKAYDGNDSIHLKAGKTVQTMDLQTIGAYENIYVLATAGGPGPGNYARFQVTLTYTDGTTDGKEYQLYDWYDTEPVDGVEQVKGLYRLQVQRWEPLPGGKFKEVYQESDGTKPIMHSATIQADPTRLLKSITFTMKGKNETDDKSGLYCGIYAVTGAVSANAPAQPTALPATNVNSGTESPGFTANWEKVDKATGYRLDVSELENFTTLLDGYNNADVTASVTTDGNTVSAAVTGLTSNTTYYYRVRAVNSSGQSLGSKRIATDLPQWVRNAGLSKYNATYDVETGTLQLKDGASVTKPLVIPNGAVFTLDLNGKLLTAVDGQPVIQAPNDGVVELILKDSTSTPGSSPTLIGGDGKPAIDFSHAAAGSVVTLSGGTSVQGGTGTADGKVGDGIQGNANTTIVVGADSAATGGIGGAGGNGGNGVTGGSVTINGNATGGIGGENTEGTGGTGGIGASGDKINGSGTATGGNGGGGTTGGAGGAGVVGTPGSDLHVTAGAPGSAKKLITITGLTAPTPNKVYDGTPIENSVFGTATFDQDWTGKLEYTYYSVDASGVETRLNGAPKDAGNYKVVAAIPAGDATYIGKHAPISFTIAAKPVTVTDGDLAVKKAFGSNADAVAVTGKLGLTDVLAADAATVSVKIDSVGAYADADANVGKNKTVTLTISLEGSAASNYTLGSVTTYEFKKAEITKAAYAGTAATAPDGTPITRGDKSITIATVTPPTDENVEYAVSKTSTPPTSDSDWQLGTTFDNLDPNTTYFFFARVKENDNHTSGAASSGTQITTDGAAYTGTQTTAPTATKTHDTVTLHTQTIDGETVEYAKSTTNAAPTNAGEWQTEVAFTGLAADTTYYFFARVKANGTHQAGTTSASTAIKTRTAPTTVSGIVKDSSDAAVNGATVTLRPSSPLITAITDTSGAYTLNSVPEGVYSIVVTKGTAPNTVTITETVTVKGTAITGKDMQFLAGNKNTVVESTASTPEIAAGGVNDLLNSTNIGTTLTADEKNLVENSGGSVEIKVKADLKTAGDVTADKSAIEGIAGADRKIDLLLDLSVKKTVKDSSGNPVTNDEKITTLSSIIVIHLPIPAELQGKAGLSLYRMHNENPEALQKDTADENGEYYTIDSSGEFMTVYVKNFSTYALGYTTFTATVSDGGTGASGAGKYANGDTVTINAGSKSGYSFNGWTVTPNTVVLANPSSASTTFVMPAEAVTVTAGWTSTGGGNPGGGGGGGTTTTYPNTAKQPKNGTVTMTPASPSKGQTVTITTKPDAGYVVDTILVKDANGKTIAVAEKGANSYTFTQPTGKVTVEVTYTKGQTGASFTDVTANDWCYDAIMEAVANGWFNGTSATTFSPKAPTTRGMIATILHCMEGTPKASAASFNDVAAADCFANGVAWAQANGIVQGYGNGNYGPNNNIAREQLAAILYRYAGYKGYDVSKTAALGGFADASDVSGYAEEAMGWAVGNGILSGRGDNTLAPNGAATRAEVATILVRFAELFAK